MSLSKLPYKGLKGSSVVCSYPRRASKQTEKDSDFRCRNMPCWQRAANFTAFHTALLPQQAGYFMAQKRLSCPVHALVGWSGENRSGKRKGLLGVISAWQKWIKAEIVLKYFSESKPRTVFCLFPYAWDLIGEVRHELTVIPAIL